MIEGSRPLGSSCLSTYHLIPVVWRSKSNSPSYMTWDWPKWEETRHPFQQAIVAFLQNHRGQRGEKATYYTTTCHAMRVQLSDFPETDCLIQGGAQLPQKCIQQYIKSTPDHQLPPRIREELKNDAEVEAYTDGAARIPSDCRRMGAARAVDNGSGHP